MYPCLHKIKNKEEQKSKLKRKKKNKMLLNSNPHLLTATASYPLGCRGIVIFSIVPQSKAHILRSFPRLEMSLNIFNTYVSGQCRQTIRGIDRMY